MLISHTECTERAVALVTMSRIRRIRIFRPRVFGAAEPL